MCFVATRASALLSSVTGRSLGGATGYVSDLLQRLRSTQVFDFCRQLGIATAHAVGEGFLEPMSETGVWREGSASDLP